MRARPTYTDAQIRAFIAAARGGRDRRADVLDAMRRHPAGRGPRAPRPDHPPMTFKAVDVQIQGYFIGHIPFVAHIVRSYIDVILLAAVAADPGDFVPDSVELALHLVSGGGGSGQDSSDES